jgi:hypothetical protein
MMFLPKLFRRKPTPQNGRAILENAIRKTLDQGLSGYVIGEVRDEIEGEVVFSVRGDIAEGLSQALQMLLENPDTKAAAQYAIVSALRATGRVRQVRGVAPDDCGRPDCPVCRGTEE